MLQLGFLFATLLKNPPTSLYVCSTSQNARGVERWLPKPQEWMNELDTITNITLTYASTWLQAFSSTDRDPHRTKQTPECWRKMVFTAQSHWETHQYLVKSCSRGHMGEGQFKAMSITTTESIAGLAECLRPKYNPWEWLPITYKPPLTPEKRSRENSMPYNSPF